MKNTLIKSLLLTGLVSLSFVACTSYNNDTAKMDKKMISPFGHTSDLNYSKDLWKKLESTNLNKVSANLYVGGTPSWSC